MPSLILSESPTGLSVELSWKTEISRCDDIEFRRARRDIPRASFRWSSFITEGQHMRFLDAWIDKTTAVSVFDWRYAQGLDIDGTLTIATVQEDFWYPVDGDTVAIVAPDETYEIRTIDSVVGSAVTLTTATTIEYGYIVPVLNCEFKAQPEFKFISGIGIEASVSLEITNYPDLSSWVAPITLDGVAVRTNIDLLKDSSTRKVDRGTIIFPGTEGPYLQEDLYTSPRRLGFISINAKSLAERFNEESFLHFLCGMDRAFWKSSWLNDFIVNSAASSGASQISVSATDSQTTAPAAIHLPGTNSYHQVTNITPSGASLLLDISPNLTADVADGAVVHDLLSVRLGSDTLSLRYGEALVCEMNVGTVEIPHDV